MTHRRQRMAPAASRRAATAASKALKLGAAGTACAILLVIVPLSQALAQSAASQQFASGSFTPASNFDLASSSDLSEQQPQAGLVSQEASRRRQEQQVSQKSPLNGRQFGDTISDIHIECNSNNIVVTLQTNSGFNGMIYPKGLSKNSTCMTEYHQLASNITYYLPLKSCNTMSTDVEDGVEYFNTVMVQPHRRLVTNQGRGYHIRCRYQTKERTITNQEQQLSVNLTQVTPAVMGSASMPSCTMRIYSSSDLSHEVSAENVRIGDELQLVITLDDQDVYGMLVTNCLVRDGMNWGEQPLIDDRGCPLDEEIMPEFQYAKNLTRASVTFQAHKFPYTSSVYYQCNVRLCFKDNGCQAHVPPNCSQGARHGRPPTLPPAGYKSSDVELGHNELAPAPQRTRATGATSSARSRRWVDAGEIDGVASEDLLKAKASGAGRDMTIEVSSGLRVAEREAEPAPSVADADPLMAASTNDDPEVISGSAGETSSTDGAEAPTEKESARDKQRSERDYCMSLRKFAIIVSLISLLLMAAIIILIACLIQRRNRQRLESQLEATHDYHNHHEPHYAATPYANRAYCRD